jgi:hypothetical protein
MAACGGPVAFDAFVAALGQRIVEPRQVAKLPVSMASHDLEPDRVIGQRHLLEQVWDEVPKLPRRQRVALLLNLRDVNGSGMLWLLPVAGVATIRQIALILEIPDAEFAQLWRELPLDDAAIAVRLGCTRQQVINLRVSARKRLANRLARDGGLSFGRSHARGNVAPFSASLKGRA